MQRFAEAGDQVAATHRSPAPAPPTPSSGPAASSNGSPLWVSCDVTSTESVDAAFTAVESAFGGMDIVVANAGVTADTLLLRMSDDAWSQTLDTNLSGAFRVVRRAIKPMMRARSGSIVLISSAGAAAGVAGQINYTASKAGLVGLARSTVRELGGRNIRVNVVAPGPTDTDMTAVLTDTQREAMRTATPLGRFAQPDEIAQVIEWVARSTFMAGAVVPVDGGASMGQ